MNDHEIDRLVASAASVRDAWVVGLDLGDAETELMEEIMATTNPSAGTPAADMTRADTPAADADTDTDTEAETDEASGPSTRQPSPSPLDWTARSPRRLKLAVAAGVVAASLVGVVLVRSTGGNDSGDRGADVGAVTETGAVTPMIADPVPAGFEVDMAMPPEGPDPEPVPPAGPINMWLYGDLTATAVTNDVMIRVEPGAGPAGSALPTDARNSVTVRGRPGLVCTPERGPCSYANNVTGVSWMEDSGTWVTIESRSFDREQLLAIAEGVVVDGDRAELGSFPAGLTKPPKVAELDDTSIMGYLVGYSSPDRRGLSVEVRPVTGARRIYDLWWSGPRDDLTVQGHDAALEEIDGSYLIAWEPAPGQSVRVWASGVDEATARSFAETVRPATAAEWARVQESAARAHPPGGPSMDEAPAADAAHRQLVDGSTEVYAWRPDEGGFCYDVHIGGMSTSKSCSHARQAMVWGVAPVSEGDQPLWDPAVVVGVAPEETASIDGGEVSFGGQVDVGRLFVWEGPDGEMPDSLTFRDADGDEIDTVDVSFR